MLEASENATISPTASFSVATLPRFLGNSSNRTRIGPVASAKERTACAVASVEPSEATTILIVVEDSRGRVRSEFLPRSPRLRYRRRSTTTPKARSIACVAMCEKKSLTTTAPGDNQNRRRSPALRKSKRNMPHGKVRRAEPQRRTTGRALRKTRPETRPDSGNSRLHSCAKKRPGSPRPSSARCG